MKSIKVALIGSRLLPSTAALFNHLGDHYEICLDLLLSSETRASLPDGTEIRPQRVQKRVFKGISLPLFSDPGITYDVSLGILRQIVSTQYDLYILTGYYLFSTQVAFAISMARSCPYILHIETHGHGRSVNTVKRLIKEPIVKLIVKYASAHIAVSSWAEDYLIAHGANSRSIFVVPHLPSRPWGLDPANLSEKVVLRRRHGMADDSKVVLWVGRMVGLKRLDTLLRAFKMLVGTTNAQLVLVGSGPEESVLRQMQQDLMLHNVHFVGAKSQDEVQEFYRMADVFVLPSSSETFGAVVPEAMAHGLPIVTTNVVGSSADFVVDGQNGFVVQPFDASALENALAQILGDDELRRRMAHSSFEIMGNHSIEKNGEIFMNALDYALKRKRERC